MASFAPMASAHTHRSPRSRLRLVGDLVVAALLLTLLLTPQQSTASHVYLNRSEHSINDWTLYEYLARYRSGEWIAWDNMTRFRWNSDTPRDTQLHIAYYADYGLYEAVDIQAGDQTWNRFSTNSWFVGNAMVLRGKTFKNPIYNKYGTLDI